MALITNPIVNSYKRLVPGYEAPTELTWTKNNQNSLVRIPGSRGMETRIELRSPDAAANPYLVFAVCLAAGLDGINKKIYPTKSSSRELSETDQKTMKIENLPGNLNEAIDYFEQNFVKNTQQPRKKNGFAIQEKFQPGKSRNTYTEFNRIKQVPCRNCKKQ